MTDLKEIVDDLDRPIWGAESFGRVIGRSESEVFHLLRRRLLNASKIGGRWASTPRRLLNSLQEGDETSNSTAT